MPTQSSSASVRSLLVAAAGGQIAPVSGMSQVVPIRPTSQIVPVERFAKIVPKKPTRREKQVGKEVAVRAMVMEGHMRLHYASAIALTRMHDHTHGQIVEGIVGMNGRVRSIINEEDQTEIAAITADQKTMFVRQQFALLEAGAYRVAAEVDRELYVPPARGVLAALLGD